LRSISYLYISYIQKTLNTAYTAQPDPLATINILTIQNRNILRSIQHDTQALCHTFRFSVREVTQKQNLHDFVFKSYS